MLDGMKPPPHAIARRARLALSVIVACASLLPIPNAAAQVREQLVPFDSAGRVSVITPPLAARLGLQPPLWPVTGDYVDARLYVSGDSARSFVLVVRRPHDVMERYPVGAALRTELAVAVARGDALAREINRCSAPFSSPRTRRQ